MTTSGPYMQIRYTIEDSVATIELHRPEKLNAFTETMRAELLSALDAADEDDDVRAIMVTGAGRAFCAGADMSGEQNAFTLEDPASADAADVIDGVPRDRGGQLTLRLAAMNKPLIAAINGPAVGVGITMTLAMDVRLAGASARMGFVFSRRGLLPEAASTWFLPRIVGIAQALEWTYSGKLVPPDEALAGRLVSRVYPDDELMPAARALAAEFVTGTSAVALALTRRMMWSSLGAPSPFPHHRMDSVANDYLKKSGETAEGVQAFLEKRTPEFPLRVSTGLPGNVLPEWP